MTLEEAKDILKKEFAVINLHKSTEPFEFDDSNWFGYEKPSVLEAFRVLSKEGYYITISGHDYDMRKKRLEKEYEKNTKAPGSAENLIKEDSGVNPALEEAASQFNDALLDEQAKKIKSLVKDITHMDNVIYKKNLEIEELKKKVAEKTKLVEMVRNGSKEYCEYGIAAEKMIQKMAKDIVNDRPVSPKDYEQYRHWAKGYRFNPQLPERTDEEEKKPNTSKITLDDLKEKAYNSFNAKAHNLGLVGSKDGNGILDQLFGVDIAEEGGDHSDVIVLCGKDFIDAIKKMK